MTGIELGELSVSDARELAEIHLAGLPRDPASLLGLGFLAEALYPSLLKNAEVAIGVKQNDVIVGFVIMGRQVTSYEIARSIRLRTCLPFIGGLLSAPREWSKIVSAARYSAFAPTQPGTELQWIVVRNEFQGLGLGRQLVSEALEIAASENIEIVWVKTLAATPWNTKFYLSCGFSIQETQRGRVVLSIEVPKETLNEKDQS